MTQLPDHQPEDFHRKLQRWNQMALQLRDLKIAEILLRKELFGEAFPEPVEGTLYLPLGNGWRLKGNYSLSRSVDITHLGLMREAMDKLGASIDPLLNWKVDLRMTPYRELSDEARKLFDNIVTTKPDSPKLELVPPTDDKVDPPVEVKEPVVAAPEQVQTESVTITVPSKKKTTRRKKVVTEE